MARKNPRGVYIAALQRSAMEIDDLLDEAGIPKEVGAEKFTRAARVQMLIRRWRTLSAKTEEFLIEAAKTPVPLSNAQVFDAVIEATDAWTMIANMPPGESASAALRNAIEDESGE